MIEDIPTKVGRGGAYVNVTAFQSGTRSPWVNFFPHLAEKGIVKPFLLAPLNSKTGFTILETLVAVAIAGIAMAAVVTMIEQIATGTAEQKFVYQGHDMFEEVRGLLGSGPSCLDTFQAIPVSSIPSDSVNKNFLFATPIYKDMGTSPSGKNQPSPQFTTGDTKWNAFKIRDMYLNNNSYSNTSGGVFTLNIDLDAITKVQGTSSLFGQINITYTVDGSGAMASCVAMSNATDGLWKVTPGTNQDIYYSGGVTSRVGIGVTAPTYPLHLSNANPIVDIENSSGAATHHATIRFNKRDPSSQNDVGTFETGVDVGASGAQNFYVQDDVANPAAVRLLIDGAGNVGVGTTAPATKLHVIDGSGKAGLFLQNSADNTVAKLYNSGGTFLETGNKVTVNSLSSQPLILNAGGGSVGIGTTNLVSPVTMYTKTSNLATLSIPDTSGSWLTFMTGATGKFAINYEKVQGVYRATVFRNQSYLNSNLDRWFEAFQSAGSGPQYDTVRFFGGTQETGNEQLIQDNGSFYVRNGNIYVTGNIGVTGTVTAQSDERLKKDIKVIPGALEALTHIRGVTYVWKDPKREAGPQIGVIAQDVEKVFPAAVKTDQDGFKSVNYSGLVGPVIEAIKELWAYVTGLKSRLEEQQKEISGLKAEMDELRRELAKKH